MKDEQARVVRRAMTFGSTDYDIYEKSRIDFKYGLWTCVGIAKAKAFESFFLWGKSSGLLSSWFISSL